MDHHSNLHVHDILELELVTTGATTSKTVVQKVDNMKDMFEETLKKMYMSELLEHQKEAEESAHQDADDPKSKEANVTQAQREEQTELCLYHVDVKCVV